MPLSDHAMVPVGLLPVTVAVQVEDVRITNDDGLQDTDADDFTTSQGTAEDPEQHSRPVDVWMAYAGFPDMPGHEFCPIPPVVGSGIGEVSPEGHAHETGA